MMRCGFQILFKDRRLPFGGCVGWGWGGFQGQKIEFEQEDGAWDASCVGSFFSFFSFCIVNFFVQDCAAELGPSDYIDE